MVQSTPNRGLPIVPRSIKLSTSSTVLHNRKRRDQGGDRRQLNRQAGQRRNIGRKHFKTDWVSEVVHRQAGSTRHQQGGSWNALLRTMGGPRRSAIGCLVAVAAMTAFSVVSSALAGPPNLVFLMSDDQCTYSLGCYGTPRVKTPHLDKLARDGMVFDRHYVTTAICMASRASVMTGMHEYKTGCNFEHGPLLQAHWRESYPVLLRQAGYLTAFAGKFGFQVAAEAGQRGELPENDFDWWGGGPGQTFYETAKNESMARYAAEYPHSTLAYAAFACDFIQHAATQSQPFCLSISFKAPHRPVTPDPRFDDVYAGQTFVRPMNFGRHYGRHFSPQSRQGRQYERFHSWEYSTNYDAVMAKYYQQIYAIDVAVARIREQLERSGVADQTIVIFTSDNGFMCGSHGYGSKVLPYEEASRVPLIMYVPGHPNSGRQLRADSLTGNVDIAATLLDAAGCRSRHSRMAVVSCRYTISRRRPFMNSCR